MNEFRSTPPNNETFLYEFIEQHYPNQLVLQKLHTLLEKGFRHHANFIISKGREICRKKTEANLDPSKDDDQWKSVPGGNTFEDVVASLDNDGLDLALAYPMYQKPSDQFNTYPNYAFKPYPPENRLLLPDNVGLLYKNPNQTPEETTAQIVYARVKTRLIGIDIFTEASREELEKQHYKPVETIKVFSDGKIPVHKIFKITRSFNEEKGPSTTIMLSLELVENQVGIIIWESPDDLSPYADMTGFKV
jgi:uncharacterized protein YqeY